MGVSQWVFRHNIPVAGFIAHISRLGISVINQSAEEAENDMDALDDWQTFKNRG